MPENVRDDFSKKTQADIPAPPTLTFIQDAKVDMAILKTKIDNVCDQLKTNSDEHRLMMEKIDDFMVAIDQRKADKEELFFWRNLLVSGILVSILLGIVGLLLSN